MNNLLFNNRFVFKKSKTEVIAKKEEKAKQKPEKDREIGKATIEKGRDTKEKAKRLVKGMAEIQKAREKMENKVNISSVRARARMNKAEARIDDWLKHDMVVVEDIMDLIKEAHVYGKYDLASKYLTKYEKHLSNDELRALKDHKEQAVRGELITPEDRTARLALFRDVDRIDDFLGHDIIPDGEMMDLIKTAHMYGQFDMATLYLTKYEKYLSVDQLKELLEHRKKAELGELITSEERKDILSLWKKEERIDDFLYEDIVPETEIMDLIKDAQNCGQFDMAKMYITKYDKHLSLEQLQEIKANRERL